MEGSGEEREVSDASEIKLAMVGHDELWPPCPRAFSLRISFSLWRTFFASFASALRNISARNAFCCFPKFRSFVYSSRTL